MNHRAAAFALFLILASVGPLAAAERVTYEKDVRKIITARCLDCHGADAPSMDAFKKDPERFKKAMKGPRTDTYPHLMVMVNGLDTGALMRRLDDGRNTREGKPGNMYEYLGDTEAERAANLQTIQRWVGGWTLKRNKEISPEERKAILAPER